MKIDNTSYKTTAAHRWLCAFSAFFSTQLQSNRAATRNARAFEPDKSLRPPKIDRRGAGQFSSVYRPPKTKKSN